MRSRKPQRGFGNRFEGGKIQQEGIASKLSNIDIIQKWCYIQSLRRMLMVILFWLLGTVRPSLIDLNQTNLYSNSSILQTICNKDMEVDFYFHPATTLTCANRHCSLTAAEQSSLFFLDPKGVYLRLKLTHAQLTSQDLVAGYNVPNCRYAVFYFADEYMNKVNIIVPFVHRQAHSDLKHLLNLEKINDGSFQVQPIKKWMNLQDPSQGFPLDAFNFLNFRDYSRFAQVANYNKTHTLLISEWVFGLSYNYPVHTTLPKANFEFTPDYAGSGNKICYASYSAGTGMFQTRLRQNWSLWTCFFVILFFWAYYLIAPARNNEVFDPRFRENKMTCWGFYSLHHLAHDEFFPRLLRESLLLLSNAWEAMVLAALYTRVGVGVRLYSDYSMIIWFAVVAVVSSRPLQYVMSGVLVRKIYSITEEQLSLKRTFRLNQVHSKEILNTYLLDNYKIECRLAQLYYWYYLIIFFAFLGFWAPTIHMTLWMHLQFYYLQRLWFASFIISFLLGNLIIGPFLSCLLGNFTIARRLCGFYYKFELGELYQLNQFAP